MSIFGRGGIVDRRGRIVPGGPGATTLPLAYYAEGAWAIYSPPQPGNLFVAGSSYSILADQSGN